LEGTLTQLSPGFDLVAEAPAFAARDGGIRRDPESSRQLVAAELMTLLPMLRRLPRRAERIASAAEHGRLSIHGRLRHPGPTGAGADLPPGPVGLTGAAPPGRGTQVPVLHPTAKL
jgi:hypothetical protein